MQTALQKNTTNCPVIWRRNDLMRIHRIVKSGRGVGSVPSAMIDWMYYFIAILHCGVDTVDATVWDFTESFRNSTGRGSRSTTKRALQWLARQGLIDKYPIRAGIETTGLHVRINRSRFSFLLKILKPPDLNPLEIPFTINVKSSDTVDKSNEMWENDILGPEWSSDKLTSDTNNLQIDTPKVVTLGIKSKNHASVNTKIRKIHKHHPIIYTLWIITEFFRDRWQLLAAARSRLAKHADKDPIRWNYWAEKWLFLSHCERENIAAQEILPYLIDEKPDKPVTRSRSAPRVIRSKPVPPPPDLNRLISAICGTNLGPEPEDLKPPKYIDSPKLSAEDNKILQAAQKKLFWAKKNQILD